MASDGSNRVVGIGRLKQLEGWAEGGGAGVQWRTCGSREDMQWSPKEVWTRLVSE